MRYKTIIIGAGSGGFDCAKHLASAGFKVLLVEKDELGGTCTNYGCIPTKALISSVKLIHSLKTAKRKGIQIESFMSDISQINQRKNRIVKTIQMGIRNVIENHSNIDLVYGEAKIISIISQGVIIKVLDKTYQAENLVIATGSRPITIANQPSKSTSKDFLNIQKLPKKLTIVGGGVIGCELGLIYQLLGTQVTIIEAGSSILPLLDYQISQEAMFILKRLGIKIYTNTKYENTSQSVFSENNETLIAIGRIPNIPSELESFGIKYTKSGIITNKYQQTNIPHIYAIGDVAGQPHLAHKASYQALVVANHIQFQQASKIVSHKLIPSCIYLIPEIATVGKSESECDSNKIIIKTNTYASNAKARCEDTNQGFLKIIADKKTRQILGVHIVGERASDLIQIATVLIEKKATLDHMKTIIYPHPTFSELYAIF